MFLSRNIISQTYIVVNSFVGAILWYTSIVSVLENEFAFQIKASGLPAPEREYRFMTTRRFRFDFCWPVFRVVVEIEGGTWARGRHTRGSGFEKDCEKYAEALIAGWSVLRVTGAMVEDGRAINYLTQILEMKGL